MWDFNSCLFSFEVCVFETFQFINIIELAKTECLLQTGIILSLGGLNTKDIILYTRSSTLLASVWTVWYKIIFSLRGSIENKYTDKSVDRVIWKNW